jgi:hypothetical protein
MLGLCYVTLGRIMLRLFSLHPRHVMSHKLLVSSSQSSTASCMHCVMLTIQEGTSRGYWLTFIDTWMDKYTHDKQMDWTDHRILFHILPADSPSRYILCGLDLKPQLHTAVIGTVRSLLVQFGTARQRYTCSKKIYFVGNMNTLCLNGIASVRVYILCFIRISFY